MNCFGPLDYINVLEWILSKMKCILVAFPLHETISQRHHLQVFINNFHVLLSNMAITMKYQQFISNQIKHSENISLKVLAILLQSPWVKAILVYIPFVSCSNLLGSSTARCWLFLKWPWYRLDGIITVDTDDSKRCFWSFVCITQ